jgi:adenylate kinase family enzyme
VVLAGATCAGKTTLAGQLRAALSADVVVVSDLLAARYQGSQDRLALRALGDDLEARSHGTWVHDLVTEQFNCDKVADFVIIDSARTADQVKALRRTASSVAVIVLEARLSVRKARFEARRQTRQIDHAIAFAQVESHPAERHAPHLKHLADLVIDTSDRQPESVVSVACTYLDEFER